MNWVAASIIVIVLWGVVGLFQKMGANHSSANSLLVWTTAGYIVLLPFLYSYSHLLALPGRSILLGLITGLTNALGAWCLYAAMEKGAAASVVVPLTALNPLLTVILAVLFLGERLTLIQIAGIVLAVIAAVLLSCESETPVLEPQVN